MPSYTTPGDYVYSPGGAGTVLIEVYASGGGADSDGAGTSPGDAAYVKDGSTFVCRAYGGLGGLDSGGYQTRAGGAPAEGDVGFTGGSSAVGAGTGGGGGAGPSGNGGNNSGGTGGAGGGGFAGAGGNGEVIKGPTAQPGAACGGGGGGYTGGFAPGSGGGYSKKLIYPVVGATNLDVHVPAGGIGYNAGSGPASGGNGRVDITFTPSPAGGGPVRDILLKGA